MLAAPAPANAQFGGLVKKTKKNITEKVTNKLGKDNQTTQDSQDTQGNNENSGNQTLNSANGQSNIVESYGRENDGIVIKHIENGRELATYYPNEKKWVRTDNHYFVIDEGGSAKWDNGNVSGTLTPDGFSTNGLPKIEYDEAKDAFLLDGITISSVRDEGRNTFITFLGKDWMYSSSPIDHKLMGFLTIGQSFDVESIETQIENNIAQEQWKASIERTQTPKRPDGRLSDVRDLEWLRSNEKGVPQADDLWAFSFGNLKFNGGYVASYEDNIHDYFYNELDSQVDPIIMGKYINGGMQNRNGKYLGYVDEDWNVINADNKKVGYVKSGTMYSADGQQVGYCSGDHTRFIACYVFFIFMKL